MTPAAFLEKMAPAARERFGNDKRWAAASGLAPETLSRLRGRDSCDLQTLNALAKAAGYELVLAPAQVGVENAVFGRAREEELLELCASGSTEASEWLRHGSGFLMGGIAMLLAGARGFDRRRYLELAETLHPGISHPEVFDLWLERSPLRAARFLPMVKQRRLRAA